MHYSFIRAVNAIFVLHMSISQQSELKISSLNELNALLEEGQFETVIDNIAKSNIPLSDYDAFMHFSSKHYFRNCISKSDEYELILLCWDIDQNTAIHCHDEKECFVQILQGDILEEQYSLDQDNMAMVHNGTEILTEGDTSFIDDGKLFHSLQNVGSSRAISLHLYMKPIQKCKIYDPNTGCLSTKSLSYNSYLGELVFHPIR